MIPRISLTTLVLFAMATVYVDGKMCRLVELSAPPLPAIGQNITVDSDNVTTTPADPTNSTDEESCPRQGEDAEFSECCYDDKEDESEEEDASGSGAGSDAGSGAGSYAGSGAIDGSGEEEDYDEQTEAKPKRLRCCKPAPPPFNFIDWLINLDPRVCRVSMIVALSVTGTMLLFTILVIVCCFWSKCPLYTMCRSKYNKDDIIATTCDEETANLTTDMPAEEKDGVKSFAPNEVKVTTLSEEEEPCLKKEKEQEEQPLVEKKDDKKKDDKKKEDKKKEDKKKDEKKKEEEKKKKEEEKKKKEEEKKKKEEKKKEDKKKDEKKKDEKKEDKEEEKPAENTEAKKEEVEEKKAEEPEEKEAPKETKEETKE